MFQLLQQVDQFGIQQKLQIPPINPTQKSAIGGLVTLALYGASLAYFMYQFFDWQNNNKLPKYFTVKKQVERHKEIDCPDVFAEIMNYQLQDPSYLDPFDPKNLILFPVLMRYQINQTEPEEMQAEFVQEILGDGTIVNKFVIKNVSFVGEPDIAKNSQQVDYQLNVQLCNQRNLMNDNLRCADENMTSQFFQQNRNYLQISINLYQFNFIEKALKRTPQTYFVDIVQGTLQYKEFHLKINSLDINDGLLFSNSHKLDYFTNTNIQELQFDWEYSKRFYGAEMFAALYFQIAQIKNDSVMEYPKVSEILADTVTIVSFIMQISYLVHQYNEYLCMRSTNKEIIQMYYKDYGQFKIKKNWKGQIISVSKANYDFRQKNILDFFTNLEISALKKINYLNLQYEVSRLQIFITKLLTFEDIRSYRKTATSIGQFLQDKISAELRSLQINRSQIAPESESQKPVEENLEINIDDLEQDVMKTINLLVLEQDNNQEKDIQVCNFSNSEMQVINLDSSTMQ